MTFSATRLATRQLGAMLLCLSMFAGTASAAPRIVRETLNKIGTSKAPTPRLDAVKRAAHDPELLAAMRMTNRRIAISKYQSVYSYWYVDLLPTGAFVTSQNNGISNASHGTTPAAFSWFEENATLSRRTRLREENIGIEPAALARQIASIKAEAAAQPHD